MFEYDDNSNPDENSHDIKEVEQSTTKSIKTVKSNKSNKSTKKVNKEPQPSSESETSDSEKSETSKSDKSEKQSKQSKQEKFLTGSNFDDFTNDTEQEEVKSKKDEDELVLSSDDIEELRELLKNWLELDETTKELSDRMKDIKMEKKQYETYILEFMDKTKKEIIKASDSNLVLRKDVKETRSKPNEEIILKVLTRILGDATQAYKFTQEIIEDAPVKETISLKKDSAKPKQTKQTKRTKRVKKDI